MEHLFDVEIAKKYGVNAAIVLRHLQFWIIKNKTHNTHFYDGRTWTYYSLKAFTKIFPYLTQKQIRGALETLVNNSVILKGNYNKYKNNRTTWYAFMDENTFAPEGKCVCPTRQMELPHKAKGVAPKGKSLTDVITDNPTDEKTDNSKDSSLGKSSKADARKEFCDGKERIKFGPNSDEFRLSELLLDLILERKPNFTEGHNSRRKKTLQRWAVHIDRLIRIDGRKPEHIEKVVRGCQGNDFWKNNILSTEKLRKQIDKLELAMEKTGEQEYVKPLHYDSGGLTPRERLLIKLEKEKQQEIEGTKGTQEYTNAVN